MIMAGGKGTRFWPLSRASKPKQFLSIIDRKPLIELTLSRLETWIPKPQRWILGNKTQENHLENLTHYVDNHHILKEPSGQNTAACIGWAAMEVLKEDPDAIMIILPADHWIGNEKELETTLSKACEEASNNKTLVTIGVPPTSPHTGYGYIKTKENNNGIFKVESFTEKPDLETAETYLKEGNYCWNAGIFVWRADVILDLLKENMPTHYELLEKMSAHPSDHPIAIDAYSKIDPISIDYGIMEKCSDQTRLIPATFEWSDIGNWQAIEPFLEKDSNNNAKNTKTVTVNSQNNIVYSSKKIVALADINDMIIVDTDDALLILPKSSDQEIKKLYNELDSEYK